jgi:Transglutaminase-like superfamily
VTAVEPQTYYAEQSPVTDPGELGEMLAELPPDPETLQRVARGLVLHYRAEDPAAHGVPDERLTEIDTRYAETMLDRLIELDGRQLTEERPPAKRLLGCCRDFTVLFLAMARQHGIPARARVGFATYFVPGFNVDHEVAEVWDAAASRWRLVDPELWDEHVDPNDGARVDPLDVPRDRFLVAGSAWQACRRGAADPETFLVDPGLDIAETRGWPQVRHNLLQDLAALNKVEMLLWDDWGLLLEDLAARDQELLDHVAEVTIAAGEAFAQVRRLYEDNERLRVPSTVTSFSPAVGEPRRVALKFDPP